MELTSTRAQHAEDAPHRDSSPASLPGAPGGAANRRDLDEAPDEDDFERTYGGPLPFPLAVFSFVFGENDPNSDIQVCVCAEASWH